MATPYFQNFKFRGYTLDPNARIGDFVTVTDLFQRVQFRQSLLNEARIYYPYQIRDGDTPENIAHRYYGSVEYYWVILFVNQMLDPVKDWPKPYHVFLKDLIDRYGSIETAQTTIHHYTKTITKTNSSGETHSETTIIDKEEYDSLTSVVPIGYIFPDGTTMTKTTTRAIVDVYTHEDTVNTNNRDIVLLKNEYIGQVQQELESLLLI